MGSDGSKQSDLEDRQAFINSSSSYNIGNNNNIYSNDPNQPWNSQLTTYSESNNPRLQISYPLQMPIHPTFKCDQCGMMFSNDEALFKHKTRFCVGAKDSGIGRQQIYSDEEEMNGYRRDNYPSNRSTFNVIKHHSPVEKKREEVYEWKNQRSVLQSVQDMEDRILRDSQKTRKLADDLKQRSHNYSEILLEYDRLQAQERDLLRQMFNLQAHPRSHLNQSNDLTDQSELEILQRKNTRLEQERRVIQKKLEELIASNQQPTTVTDYEPYRLLREMKEQQDINENSLLHLRRRVIYPEGSLLPTSDIPYLPYVHPSPTRFQRTTGDDLRILRDRYLRLGGHDASVIARSTDLERRLRNYEDYPWMRDYPEPLKHYRYRPFEKPADELKLAKTDNQRLQHELDQMQQKFQKLDSRTRQLELTVATSSTFDFKPNGYNSHPSSKTDHYPSSQTDQYPPINSLARTSARQTYSNYENDPFDQRRNYHQTSLPSLDRRITTHVNQSVNPVNTNISKLRDPLGPQFYDPVGGFVIFFDFIINFPPSIDLCRLITCLHHPQSGLGEPSQLEPFKCDLYVDETNGERMGNVLIATKQPVPRCPPDQELTVVSEIQITSKQKPNEPLRTNAWTKIPLFDHKNRLLSGRWKVPLKTLPIHQNETFAAINSLPTFGRAELHYRLVNSQNAADQASAPLSTNFRDLYFYPPQYRNRPYM